MNPVFLSAGLGAWYPKGVDRLRGSLIEHGWPGDVVTFQDNWPDNHWPRDSIYNIKPAVFEHAIKQGYRTLIWGDASVYATRNPQPFLDELNAKGYWIGSSGYKASQTASDAQLQYFGVDRDWADAVPDTATGLFGVNLDFPLAAQFIERWIAAGKNGAFRGARTHAGQSRDSRFLFCRQDQSAASVICGQLGMKLDDFSSMVRFRWDRNDRIFRCEGMG